MRKPSIHYRWESKMVQTLWKTVWYFLKKLRIFFFPNQKFLGIIYPKEWKTVSTNKPPKNLHMDVSSSFIKNCHNLKSIMVFFRKWMDKLGYSQTMEYYSVVKRCEWPSHEKTWRKLKCLLLSERSQSKKATYCMIPTIWLFGKAIKLEDNLKKKTKN